MWKLVGNALGMTGSLFVSHWRLLAIGALALAVVSSVGLFFKHYTGLLESVSVLQTNNELLQDAVNEQALTILEQGAAIDDWSESQERYEQTVEEAAQVARSAADEVRRLNGLFAEHDIEDLARRRPGLIQNRLNAGTADIGRMFECATGADNPACSDGDRETGSDAPNP